MLEIDSIEKINTSSSFPFIYTHYSIIVVSKRNPMFKPRFIQSIALLVLICIALISCKKDQPIVEITDTEINILKIRVPSEPDAINPIVSKTAVAAMENIIFQPLVEINPVTLDFQAVLVEEVPEGLLISDEEYKNNHVYQFKIRENAVWENGTPVTANDYIFTLKMIFNPAVEASWKRLLSSILNVYVDPNNPKNFSVIVDGDPFESLAIVGNWSIYPRYAYDPQNLMNSIPLIDIIQKEDETLLSEYPKLKEFANTFLTEKYNREQITGSGPYSFSHWSTDQSIVLERKDDYWGQNLDSICFFDANPKKLDFRVITDETTAIEAFKNGDIDVLPRISPSSFISLKETNLNQYHFYTPRLMNYLYIGINGNDPILEDHRVRQALAMLLDVEKIIESLMEGLATRTIGPINPSSSYYNHSLTPIPFNIEEAKKLLDDAGWNQENEQSLRKKTINGKEKVLSLSLKTSQRELGKQIALILQDQAKQVGIEINIEAKAFKSVLQDVRKGDFHLANLSGIQSPANYNPYGTWHTDNIGGAGRNYLGFGTKESDDLIERINKPKNTEDQKQAYLDFQRLILEDQPAIFLFSPVNCMVSQKKYNLLTSSVRPGYFINSTQLDVD